MRNNSPYSAYPRLMIGAYIFAGNADLVIPKMNNQDKCAKRIPEYILINSAKTISEEETITISFHLRRIE